MHSLRIACWSACLRTSIFELFKVGLGPSSSHTVGPMRAALTFVDALAERGLLADLSRLRIELYGSLALTGGGHGTVRAILLGLLGEKPETVEPAQIAALIAAIDSSGTLRVLGRQPINFVTERDVGLMRNKVLPRHTNGMICIALDASAREISRQDYYSIGGGFIVVGPQHVADTLHAFPFPFGSAEQLLALCRSVGKPIWQVMFENEASLRSAAEVRSGVLQLWREMRRCMERGLDAEGILPGGLQVRRRASRLYKRLAAHAKGDTLAAMDYVNVYAMAVNEENAAGNRVVTAPTNGAAGVVPAVLRYYEEFVAGAHEDGVVRFMLTAGAIGILYKENASISGAEVGCQGEVGVACSMAAAGLVAALGGRDDQVEKAAEIGMEHHLGMTCDPIAGLVQIPCIERNALGAVKAINAARLAMQEDEGHAVSLDQVIRTMYETGKDMQSRYKETSLAGLAVHVVTR